MFVNVTGMGQVRPLPRGVRPIRVPVMRRRGVSGLGQTLLERPGPGGVGIEIVDPSGNIVYSASQVAANPSLATIPSGGCPTGMVPTWYPGGQSECAVPGAQGGTQIQGAPLNTCTDPSGLCFGSTFQGGTIQTPVQLEAIPVALPAAYTSGGYQTVGSGNQPLTVTSATATLSNSSRPGQSFQVGDSWQLNITGPPNSPVSNLAVQNGNSLGVTGYGSTDANGNFSLSGTFSASAAGNWSETWSVAGQNAPALSFSVSAVQSSGGGSGSGGGSNAGSNPSGSGPVAVSSPSTTTATPGTCFAPLAQFGIPDTCVGGLPVGLATIAAGVVALFIVGSMFGGKR